ncbi:hypothetical protein GCM10009120_44150 [Sphingobacterium siyangense subsp. cladoniae]|uniref:hypothetical protein n=1 Tax=Sphingobacterium siyangense TaxID=459529 RepID=UPI0031F78D41
MSDKKTYIESISDRKLLETIYQTQIILAGRLENLQKEVDEVKSILLEKDVVETGLTGTDSLYDTVENISMELTALDGVEVDLPFRDIRSR